MLKRLKHKKLPDYAVRLLATLPVSSHAKEMPNMRTWILLAERQYFSLAKAGCLCHSATLCLPPLPICRFALMN